MNWIMWMFGLGGLTAAGYTLYSIPWRSDDSSLYLALTPERRAMIVQQERLEQQAYRHCEVRELL
jgi:hypothetical protein